MEEYICQSPVIFIFFNRPKSMKKVLEQIKKVKPQKLYLVADGPRNNDEKEKTELCRKIAIETVDWNCETVKIFADSNMGCKNRVASGITQVLSVEDRAIILEDDCVPNISFFRFMDEMLEKYKDEEKIFRVSGRNDLGIYTSEYDYIFTHRATIWGWGTWARAWAFFDAEISNWPEVKKNKKNNIRKILGRKTYYLMKKDFDKVYRGKIDTWDYQWFFVMLNKGGFGITPTKNLVKNIGFEDDATHTIKKDPRSNVPVYEMEMPLNHPTNIILDTKYMKIYNKRFVENKFVLRVIKNIIKLLIRYER